MTRLNDPLPLPPVPHLPTSVSSSAFIVCRTCSLSPIHLCLLVGPEEEEEKNLPGEYIGHRWAREGAANTG